MDLPTALIDIDFDTWRGLMYDINLDDITMGRLYLQKYIVSPVLKAELSKHVSVISPFISRQAVVQIYDANRLIPESLVSEACLPEGGEKSISEECVLESKQLVFKKSRSKRWIILDFLNVPAIRLMADTFFLDQMTVEQLHQIQSTLEAKGVDVEDYLKKLQQVTQVLLGPAVGDITFIDLCVYRKGLAELTAVHLKPWITQHEHITTFLEQADPKVIVPHLFKRNPEADYEEERWLIPVDNDDFVQILNYDWNSSVKDTSAQLYNPSLSIAAAAFGSTEWGEVIGFYISHFSRHQIDRLIWHYTQTVTDITKLHPIPAFTSIDMTLLDYRELPVEQWKPDKRVTTQMTEYIARQQGNICYTSKSYLYITLPDTIKASLAFTETLKTCTQRLFVAPITLANPARTKVTHENTLVVDTVLKTYERFEPHGESSTYDTKQIDPLLADFIGKLLPDYKQVATSDVCPRFGPQRLAEKKVGEVGLCMVWSAMYRYQRMINVNYSRDKVIHDLLTGTPSQLRARAGRFLELIKLFSNLQYYHELAQARRSAKVKALHT